MLYNVSSLLREPVGSSRCYPIDPTPPVHRGNVELIRVPSGVLVRAQAEVLIEDNCSRCLAPFAYPQHIEFEEIFAQTYDVTTGAKLAPPEDEEAFTISASHTIDITEAVRQYSEVAAAMQPLCRPDCPGICPECGQDLTIAPCRCETASVDSRWAALAALERSTNG
jgi:uncharacterized protein